MSGRRSRLRTRICGLDNDCDGRRTGRSSADLPRAANGCWNVRGQLLLVRRPHVALSRQGASCNGRYAHAPAQPARSPAWAARGCQGSKTPRPRSATASTTTATGGRRTGVVQVGQVCGTDSSGVRAGSSQCVNGVSSLHRIRRPGGPSRATARRRLRNGVVDNNMPGLGAACGLTPPCVPGVTACVGGQISAGAIPSQNEVRRRRQRLRRTDGRGARGRSSGGQNGCWNNPGTAARSANLETGVRRRGAT